MLIILIVILISVIWIACGVMAAGYTFAYYQDEFPTLAERDYYSDLRFALGMIPFGIAAIAYVLVEKETRYGWRLGRRR